MSSSRIVPVAARADTEQRRVLAQACAVRPPSAERKARVWSQLEAAIGQRRTNRAPWVALAFATVALAVSAAVQLRGARAAAWTTLDLGEVGEVRAEPGALFDLTELDQPGERRISLTRGSLDVRARRQPTQRPLVVTTPHLRAVVVGTRFVVRVEGDRSVVRVTEGTVRVEGSGAAMVALRAGESMASDDPRLALTVGMLEVQAPAAAQPRFEDCATPGPERVGCLQGVAAGSGLAAQNALYALGLAAQEEGDGRQALEVFRRYRQRFPEGPLAPEAALGALRQLLADRRWGEALAEAEAFREAHASDARAAEVALVRANLLCRLEPDGGRAVRAYDEPIVRGSPRVRDDALFGLAACLQATRARAAARSAFERYLAAFPHGAHAREAQRWLDPD